MPKTPRPRSSPSPAGASRRRAPRTRLKAERIQSATAPPGGEPLTRQEVQKSLTELPGWRLMRGNRALSRRFGFPGRLPAVAFALFVLALAGAGGFNAWVEVRGNVVAVRVFTPRARAVTPADLQFARLLAELPA